MNYVWDANNKTLVSEASATPWSDGSTQAYLGTYNSFNTISASTTKYISTSFVARLCNFVDKDEVTDDAATLPQDGSTLTIPEILALDLSAYTSKAPTTEKYYINVTVKEVYNTQYGNMYVIDADNNELTIYGTYSADGSTRYDSLTTKPVAGDTLKLYGALAAYKGVSQMVDARIIEHTPGESGGDVGGGDDNTDVPSTTSALEENVAYTVSANNSTDKLYLDGTISGGRFNCTTSEADAVSVYVENVSGGQLLYFLNNGVKTYFVFADKAAGGSTTTDSTAATVFEWNATLNTLVVADDTNNRAFGSGSTSTYTNFSAYDASQSGYNWGQFTPVAAN